MIQDLVQRSFGQHEDDINIDFAQSSRPQLIIEILQAGNVQEGASQLVSLWDLPVSRRLVHLLTSATEGGKQDLKVQLTCLSEACREPMELTLALEEFLSFQAQAEEADRLEISLNNTELSLRRPTGRDQQCWQQLHFKDERTAINTLIQTLLTGPEPQIPALTVEEIHFINEAMQAFDPLLAFKLEVSCPECGESRIYQLDLQELALNHLAQVQAQLLMEIHQLALSYHWSEKQILTLPHWRRKRYLALLHGKETQ